MKTNLYAHTESPADGREYPGFVSLNKADGGAVTLAVRSRGHGGMLQGEIVLTPDVQAALAVALAASAKVPGQ